MLGATPYLFHELRESLPSYTTGILPSFLSSRNARVIDKQHENHLYKLDLTRPAVLERGCAYIAPLMEELSLPADISGKANPKSTTGRLDVFTRLITDYGSEFERVPAGYK